MKKWIITILFAVLLVAVGFTAQWWVPWLVGFATGHHDVIEPLNDLTDLLWRLGGSAAGLVFFVVGLWQRKKDKSQSAPTAKVERSQVGRDVVSATGPVQTGGVGISGPGPSSFQAPVAGHDVIIQQVAATPGFNPLHQLPPPPADFTGREDELKELLVAIAAGGATISGLRGQGGIGKTVLALKLAERLTPNFPDAQIYMDLLGTTKPLTPGEIMAYVIRAFQPEAQLPDKEGELGGMYRTVLHGKHVLLLMDNAKDATQVRPLAPPAGCVLLVTSRFRFVLPGFQAKDLETLPPAQAEELLLKIAPRIGPEASAIARLCGYLPQALRLAATALAERRNIAPADYRQRLGGEQNRPKLLAAGNESVEASISLSYALLDAEAQKRWRMLGVFPETLRAPAAAAIWELEENAAQDALGLMVQFSMLEWNEKNERYRLHDLMRDFARAKVAPDERETAARRHAIHYLNVLRAAAHLYLEGGEAVMRGLALFDAERGNIEAGQAWAAGHAASDPVAAQACSDYPDAGAYCLGLRQHPRERIRWLEIALAAARSLRDRAAGGRHLGNLGLEFGNLGDHRRAIECYEQRLVIAGEIGDRQGEGNALGGLGIAHHSLGEYRRAIELYQEGLVIAREIGNRRGEGNALGNLGIAYHSLGDYRRASGYHEQALAISREIGDRRGEGQDLGNLGNAYHSMGDDRRAIEYHEQALTIDREIGDRRGEGQVLGNLGNAYSALGETRRAIEYYEQRLSIAREIGDQRGKGNSLWNMSVAEYKLGDSKKAIERAKAALKIYEQIEDPNAEIVRKQLDEWRKQ